MTMHDLNDVEILVGLDLTETKLPFSVIFYLYQRKREQLRAGALMCPACSRTGRQEQLWLTE